MAGNAFTVRSWMSWKGRCRDLCPPSWSTCSAIEAGTGSAQSRESTFHMTERKWALSRSFSPSSLRAP